MTLGKSIDIELNQHARGFHINQNEEESRNELKKLEKQFYIQEKKPQNQIESTYSADTSCLYKKPSSKDINEETIEALNLLTPQYSNKSKPYSTN